MLFEKGGATGKGAVAGKAAVADCFGTAPVCGLGT